jgi:peptidylprolyl isomerase
MRKYKKKSKKKGADASKNQPVLMILIGVMVFGTLAYGFLFSKPPRNESGPLPAFTQPPNNAFQIPNITLRHNPTNGTTITQMIWGRPVQFPVSHNETHIMVDTNPPLAGKTLIFNITLLNISKGSGTSPAVEEGDTVQVEYTGYLEDGEVFDSSLGGPPLEFVVGDGSMIKGFDEAVRGMEINQTKTGTIPPEDAYGPHDPARVQLIPILQVIPKRMVVTFPMVFQLPTERFEEMFATAPTVGEVLFVSELHANVKVLAAGENVTLQTLLAPGDIWQHPSLPWNSTVLWVLANELEIEHNVKAGETYQFPGMPWNTTVVAVG